MELVHKSINMTDHAFHCYIVLINFPLPPIARFIPFIFSVWNTVKGGGDTITKLDDICQKRIGIRTEVTVATAQIMLNIGVVFHRCLQMITSDDPDKYATL